MHNVPEFAKWDSEPVLQHYDDVKYDSREPLPELGRDIQAILVDKVLAIRGIAAAAADDTCGMADKCWSMMLMLHAQSFDPADSK